MPDRSATVASIKHWLEQRFQDKEVRVGDLFDHETCLFRIRTDSVRIAELEVSYEVLDHHDEQETLLELERSDTVDRMVRDPSVRVQYFSQGINHFETFYVRCDGREYTVIRDEKHNVRILDSRDRLLHNTPQQPLVLGASILQLAASEWCARVRTWRSQEQ